MEEQTTTEVNPTPEVAPQPVAQETVLGPSESDNQDWKSTLSEDLRNDPTLKNFKDVESLAKTVVHQQKQMGSRIPIPKTPEEHMEVYNKLGRPETADKYEATIPKEYQQYYQENSLNEFKNIAHEIGLNNEQVNKLLDFQNKKIEYETQNQSSQLEIQKQESQNVLKKEWGFDYDKKVRQAHRALEVYGDEEIKQLMKTEAGNNPAVIRLFARLGEDVTEDMAQNTKNNNLATSPLDAQEEITEIFDNPEHPYHNAKDKGHAVAVEKMRQLHEKVFGK